MHIINIITGTVDLEMLKKVSKSYVNLECGIRPVIEVPKSMID